MISVSSLSAFIPATSVDVSNTDVAYVGTTNPEGSFSFLPTNASGFTKTWDAPTGAALLTINPDGSVTFNAEGSASLRLTLTNANLTTVSDTTAPFTIQPMSISLAPINDGVIGSTTSLNVTTVPASLPSGASVTFSSSNPSVATVNSAGIVTRVSLGTYTITATLSFREGVFTASQEAEVVLPTEADYFMNLTEIAPEVMFTETGGRLYSDTGPALPAGVASTSPLEYNHPTLTWGRDWPYAPYNQLMTQQYFDSLSTSGGGGYWTYLGAGVSKANGPGGYTNLRVPTTFNLMALYDVQNAEFVVGPTAAMDGIPLNNVWTRYHLTATVPTGCTQMRFYIARLDASNYVYATVPVTPGTVTTFSVFRRAIAGQLQFALANATEGALTKPPLRGTSYGGNTMSLNIPLGYTSLTTFTLTDVNTTVAVTPNSVYTVPPTTYHWGMNKIEQFHIE